MPCTKWKPFPGPKLYRGKHPSLTVRGDYTNYFRRCSHRPGKPRASIIPVVGGGFEYYVARDRRGWKRGLETAHGYVKTLREAKRLCDEAMGGR